MTPQKLHTVRYTATNILYIQRQEHCCWHLGEFLQFILDGARHDRQNILSLQPTFSLRVCCLLLVLYSYCTAVDDLVT
jgi:hypothetical protein